MPNQESNATVLRTLGANFKSLRLLSEMDQKALAYESGVPVRTLSRLENGHAVSLEAVIKVMRALNILDRLELLIPSPELSPVQRARHNTAKPRQRASSSDKRSASKPAWQGFTNPTSFGKGEPG